MRRWMILAMLSGFILSGTAAPAQGDASGPETNKLKVTVGPFFTQESDKKIPLEGTASRVIRKGKRVNITVTVENYGKEKSEPVRLRYVETDGKAAEPRLYRVESIEPGKKWQRTFMARWETSGRKSVTATLVTPEDKPLVDATGKPRPDTSHTGSVSLTVKRM